MKNRSKRVEEIVDLITNHPIASQEQLAALLEARGHKVTQATLSRDLKMLKTSKITTDTGAYMYVLPDSPATGAPTPASRPESIYRSGFLSLSFSGNLAVIKTRNGYAPGLAYDIDMGNFPEIIGIIPGADTIFAVLREGVTHSRAREVLAKILPIGDEPPSDD